MSGITLVIEDEKWRAHRGLRIGVQRAAEVARKAARLKGDFTILLTGDKSLRRLNHDFRGLDKPTNVLSFPGAGGYGGDIAIAYGVTAKEAKAAGKTVLAHVTHLAVHGILHLAGYDHETPKDAKVMEPLETRILKRLGIADPYRALPQ